MSSGARPRDGGARELLVYLHVGHRESSYPEMLSGGEQQRVVLTSALANEPSLVLADEPTAAPDGTRSRTIMEPFRKVVDERGAGVLVVAHDHRALDVFDVLYEIEGGRIRPAAVTTWPRVCREQDCASTAEPACANRVDA